MSEKSTSSGVTVEDNDKIDNDKIDNDNNSLKGMMRINWIGPATCSCTIQNPSHY